MNTRSKNTIAVETTPALSRRDQLVARLATKYSEYAVRISVLAYKRQNDINRRKMDHLVYKMEMVSRIHDEIKFWKLTPERIVTAQHLLGDKITFTNFN